MKTKEFLVSIFSRKKNNQSDFVPLTKLVLVDQSEERKVDTFPEAKKAVDLYYSGKKDEALDIFQKLNKEYPNWHIPYVWIGGILEDRHEIKQAKKTFEVGIKQAKQKSDLYYEMAHLCEKQSNYKGYFQNIIFSVYAQKNKPLDFEALRMCSHLNKLLRGTQLPKLLDIANALQPFTELTTDAKNKIFQYLNSLDKEEREVLAKWLTEIEDAYL